MVNASACWAESFSADCFEIILNSFKKIYSEEELLNFAKKHLNADVRTLGRVSKLLDSKEQSTKEFLIKIKHSIEPTKLTGPALG